MQDEPLNIAIERNRIILTGRLKNSPEVDRIFKNKFSELRGAFSDYRVSAGDLRIAREGEKAWITAVKRYLKRCKLVYEPSQLSMLVQYEDDYDHQSSVFQEYDDSRREECIHARVEYVA